MHYLITGHTGFKGSWLAMMLLAQGHEVSGIALDPLSESLYLDAGLEKKFTYDIRTDIRNQRELSESITRVDPEIVIHLAAQPLVLEAYRDPIATYETNVIGTLNVLESLKEHSDSKAVLVITTDKVYKNLGKREGYVESDALGGDDPYSSSKAAADIATQSWIKSYPEFPLAIARSGNVIGGGDWSKNRIIPDIVHSITKNQELHLRYPQAIRPWQHVLDCLNGYLMLTDQLLMNQGQGEWNFGPVATDAHSVHDVVDEFGKSWGVSLNTKIDSEDFQYETEILRLNSTKSMSVLSWSNKLDFNETIKWTAEWYKERANGRSAFELCNEQISNFYQV